MPSPAERAAAREIAHLVVDQIISQTGKSGFGLATFWIGDEQFSFDKLESRIAGWLTRHRDQRIAELEAKLDTEAQRSTWLRTNLMLAGENIRRLKVRNDDLRDAKETFNNA